MSNEQEQGEFYRRFPEAKYIFKNHDLPIKPSNYLRQFIGIPTNLCNLVFDQAGNFTLDEFVEIEKPSEDELIEAKKTIEKWTKLGVLSLINGRFFCDNLFYQFIAEWSFHYE